MTAVEILLKIKALFDRKGSDEAKEAVDGVGQAGREAGGAASEGMSGAADSAREVGAAAKGAGEAVHGMGEASTGASVLTAGNIAKVTAIFATARQAVKAVAEAVVDVGHMLDGISADNLAAGCESSAEAVGRLERAYDAAARARSLLAKAQSAGIEMLNTERLASIELAKARELAAAKDDDERRRIELRYGAAASAAGSEGEHDAILARLAALRAERAEVESRISDREGMLDAQTRRFAETNKAAMARNAEAGKMESSFWTRWAITGPMGFSRAAELARRDADTLAAAAQGYSDQVRESVDAIDAMRGRLGEIALEIEREESALVVNDTLREAGRITADTASRDLEQSIADRKAEEERRREAEERAARRKAEADRLNAGIAANEERSAALRDDYDRARAEWAPRIEAARERARVESRAAATAAKSWSGAREEGARPGGGEAGAVSDALGRARTAADELAGMERELKATLDAISDELKRLRDDSRAKAAQIRALPN